MGKLNFLVIYFSGTGNTKMVCEEFKLQAEKLNQTVRLYSIDRFDAEKTDEVIKLINEAEYIGFAYPVYGANLPPIFRAFLNGIINRINIRKDVFIITTVGIINAFGPFIIKKMLGKFGLKLRWHMVCRVFNNTKYMRIDENKMIKIKSRIQGQIEHLIRSILNNKSSLKGVGPWLVGGYIVRKILNKPLREHYRKFYVDKSLCTLCMLCFNHCPASAIDFQNDNFIFNANCTTCFRCKNKCPVGAVKD